MEPIGDYLFIAFKTCELSISKIKAIHLGKFKYTSWVQQVSKIKYNKRDFIIFKENIFLMK